MLLATAVTLVASVAVAALPVHEPDDPEAFPVTLPTKPLEAVTTPPKVVAALSASTENKIVASLALSNARVLGLVLYTKFIESASTVPLESLANCIKLGPEPVTLITGLVPSDCAVIVPLKLSSAFDLKKLPEETPSNVSASSPLPAPSTVLINVRISLAV